MIRVLRGAGAAALTLAMTVVLVALSRVPWAQVAGEDGQLRLAWQLRSEPVERCRRASAEELAKLPAHMRRETICERGLRPWALAVSVDGAELASDTVRPRGARADRPLNVFHEIGVAPGRHRLRVAFAPLGGDPAGPAPLVLDTVVTFAPRQVRLVTLEESGGFAIR